MSSTVPHCAIVQQVLTLLAELGSYLQWVSQLRIDLT